MLDPVDQLVSDAPEIGRTDALLVVHRGDVIVEHYGVEVDATTTMRSWSIAKSMLHAAVGLLVDDGALDLEARAPVAAWADPDDPRHAITLRHLMTMQSGLTWCEAPVHGVPALPDSYLMVYGNDGGPQEDTAAWAADRPLAIPPGTALNYSSGNSAIVSTIVRDLVGTGPAYRSWLHERLFDPLGMASATPRFDSAGSWMASSFCFCSARDFARFGQLYLDGGMVGDRRLLTEDWVATAGRPTGGDGTGAVHTMHWWRFGDNPWGAFHASGYLGQYVVVVPPLDLVVVRLGETPTASRDHVLEALTELIRTFDTTTRGTA